ncbi:MAG TPA: peptidoglycan-binding domain-containing protein [Candidatus Paceibacterota bacterium]
MHQKHHHLIIATYALLVLAAPLIWAPGAHAQVAGCPLGYVCTPIQPSASTNAFYNANSAFYNTNSAFTNVQANAAQVQSGYAVPGLTTYSSACYVLTSDLSMGSRGSQVSALQQVLNAQGYALPVTGYYGSLTAAAVSQYQASHGLTVTGSLGAADRAKICAGTYQPGTTSTGTTNVGVQALADIKVNGADSVGVYNNATVRVSWVSANTSYCQATGSMLNLVGGGVWGNQGRLASNGTADVIAYTNGTLPSDLRIGIQCFRSDGASVTDTSVISVNPSSTADVQPTISSIFPLYAAGATTVTIAGTNLGTATSLDFRNSAGVYAGSVPVTIVSSTNAIATISAAFVATLPSGTYQVSIATGSCKGGCDSNRLSFTIVNSTLPNPPVTTTAAPVLYSISPASALPPLIATLTGANLTGASVVNFTNSAGQFAGSATTNNVTADRLYFMIPSLPAGTYQMSVVTNACKAGCDSNKVTFTALSQTAPTSPVNPPTVASRPVTTLVVSPSSVTVGSPITLSSVTTSSSGTLRNAAIDQSSDNATWTSGAPCGYWSNTGSENARHTITCSFIPTTPGTYYFRARGSDSIGFSDFVYINVVVSPGTASSAPTPAPVTTCQAGYVLSFGVCTPVTAFYGQTACTGTEPAANAYTQKGQNSHGYGYTPAAWTYTAGTPGACQYTCVNGGTNNGSSCTIPVSSSTSTNGPTAQFSVSRNTLPAGGIVNLVAVIKSPSSSLRNAAIDVSTDNMTWQSGAACGYWSSQTGTDADHTIYCNYTPQTAGTYYLRFRGSDNAGVSDFVYQTLQVQ